MRFWCGPSGQRSVFQISSNLPISFVLQSQGYQCYPWENIMGSGSGKGRLVVKTLESQILKTNPLGDPSVREVFVYLPASYDKGSTMYPVVLCLAGYTGSARSFFNYQAWTP